MLCVIVAEKRRVRRSCGSAPRMTPRSLSNVASNNRSASSSTRNLHFLSAAETPCDDLIWSASRPGVAITTCGRLHSSVAWRIMSSPPTTTVRRSPMDEPSAANCSSIWNASSRVGVSTSAKIPKGSLARSCRIGRAKAAVLPLPVSADAITSLPFKTAGMQCHCTSVGRVRPTPLHDFTSQFSRPIASNVRSSWFPAINPPRPVISSSSDTSPPPSLCLGCFVWLPRLLAPAEPCRFSAGLRAGGAAWAALLGCPLGAAANIWISPPSSSLLSAMADL
mmetsp:Transcript_79926/g.117086  ORF Transcript_79926/g.117086 Transcript_79926/m.117086 type:complete len:279 (+) Transcript_79926:754-1590(+)